MSRPRLALAICLIAAPGLAAAQLGGAPLLPDPQRLNVPIGRGGTLALPGTLRLAGGRAEGAPVRAEDPTVGRTLPDDDSLSARLRLQPALSWIGEGFFFAYKLQLDAEVEGWLLGGEPVAGLEHDPVQRARERAPTARLTQAYVEAVGRWMGLKAGLTRSSFGLHTIADGGEDPDPFSVRASPFGYAELAGDRVLRAQLALFPWAPSPTPSGRLAPPLALVGALDGVVADENADYAEGDRAWQAIGGLFGHADVFSGGGGVVYRAEDHAEGGRTEVLIWLALLRAESARVEGRRVFMEAELAGYSGRTDLLRSALRPGDYDIRSVGGLARLGGELRRLAGTLELGLASGDDNPFDTQLHTFTFDRGHRAGLLLFQHYNRQQTAVAAHNLADPTYREFTSRGFDRVPTGGAIQNAIYLNPRLAWGAAPGLSLSLGYLYAVSEEPYTDPFRTGVAGGVSTGPRGAARRRALGHELDLGIAWRAHLPGLRLTTRAQIAYLLPGAVFDSPTGAGAAAQTGGWLHMEASW